MWHELDSFGAKALEAQVRAGSSRDAVVRTAARYYLADRESGRIAWRPPRFLRAVDEPAATLTETNVELDDVTSKALEKEARQQGLAPDRLAEHALLYYLADLSTGRAAARFGSAL
jgi:hypothetical protein